MELAGAVSGAAMWWTAPASTDLAAASVLKSYPSVVFASRVRTYQPWRRYEATRTAGVLASARTVRCWLGFPKQLAVTAFGAVVLLRE